MSQDTKPTAPIGTPLGEISQAPPALEMFLDKHQMKIVALAALLAILAVVYVVDKGITEGGEKTAGALLAKAEDISDLQGVVKNHEGTAAANSAKVLLAEKQWEDGQQDDAVSTLKGFIESGSSHPALTNAKASLASKLLVQGKQDEAAEMFRALSDDPKADFLAPYAWIALGDIAAAKGDNDAAEKAYGVVEMDFPGSSFSRDAAQRALLLKAKAPVEVAAPITVPDANLTEEEADSSGELNLIDAATDESGDLGTNPLLEGTSDSE